MSEHRSEFRGRTFLGGQLVFNDRFSTLDCLVRNLSPRGAKLVFAHPVQVPDEFELMIRKKGGRRRVRVIWRQDLEVGVEFFDSNDGVVVSLDEERLKRDRANLQNGQGVISDDDDGWDAPA